MSNYASSVLTNAQAALSEKFNKQELRRNETPVLNMALQNQDYLIVDAQAIKTSENRTVEVKYRKKRAAGSATAKVAAHTGTKGDSGTLNLSYSVFTEPFYLSQKQAFDNIYSYEQMFQHELSEAIKNLKTRMETSGVTYMFANRCQLSAPTTVAGSWNASNYAVELTDKTRFVQLAKTFMTGRNFSGQMDMIADLYLYPELEYQMNQGAGNSSNNAFQFAGVNIMPTVDVISSAYTTGGSALMLPTGSFAGLNWNDPLNRKGFDAGNNEVGMFGTLLDPYGSGFVFDISKYSKRADDSSAGGGVQDVQDQWEVTATIAWALAPLSTASDSPAHLMALAG